jgi:hypothetical protein
LDGTNLQVIWATILGTARDMERRCGHAVQAKPVVLVVENLHSGFLFE